MRAVSEFTAERAVPKPAIKEVVPKPAPERSVPESAPKRAVPESAPERAVPVSAPAPESAPVLAPVPEPAPVSAPAPDPRPVLAPAPEEVPSQCQGLILLPLRIPQSLFLNLLPRHTTFLSVLLPPDSAPVTKPSWKSRPVKPVPVTKNATNQVLIPPFPPSVSCFWSPPPLSAMNLLPGSVPTRLSPPFVFHGQFGTSIFTSHPPTQLPPWMFMPGLDAWRRPLERGYCQGSRGWGDTPSQCRALWVLRKAEKRYINVINYYYYYIVLPFSLVLSVHYSNLLCVRHCLLALSTSPVIRRILSQLFVVLGFSSVPSLLLPCPVLSCRLRSWSAPFSCHVARPVQHLQNLECGVLRHKFQSGHRCNHRPSSCAAFSALWWTVLGRLLWNVIGYRLQVTLFKM